MVATYIFRIEKQILYFQYIFLEIVKEKRFCTFIF
jgi:hypothetical protein